MTTAITTDVLVVGAGPTGLLLAGDLAAAGVDVTLVERRSPEVSNITRAFGVHARTLELLDARGLADDLVAKGMKLDQLRLFSGLSLDLSGLPSRFPFLLITPQYEVERALEPRAREAGVRIVHGADVVALRQDASGVEVDVRVADGSQACYRASYVVGADGVRSTVRRLLDLPFPGHSVISSIVLADVRLKDEPADALTVNGTGDAFAFIAPFGDGWYRVMGWDRSSQLPDSAPVDIEDVRAIARQALGTDFGMHDVRWMSRFHSDERQVPQYRVGRVFLAGDAAHVHSPAGGQGMNTGLQDAVNLSWKLAAVVRGAAGDELLDTYQSERLPVGRGVLRSSGAIIRLAMAHNPVQRLGRDILVRVVGSVRPLRSRVIGMLTGLGISYDGARRAPDHDLIDADGKPTRLYELLRAGRHVLITPPATEAPVEPHIVHATWPGRGRSTVLIRPDGYTAESAR